ncbi:hypothetical protein bcgnr5378_61970 [Bacillus cereus]|uniref:Cell division protein FtsL n=1 Tax=Bacillus cereus TaxID=1396 RepID=A0A162PHW7_BACCE|nr:septum formation initiator family protein [Bacillus cereus]KZD72059.1 hypothetical protein B4088_0520 [Bacillus cereus]HDR8321568.1 septum formation initiator family protein [Bacillus cereus]HDR8327253.1 septum formation initiator family protein [Bacillus cereus]HDR8333031.1 septum formation initiator family protein [Bacillus cereus]
MDLKTGTIQQKLFNEQPKPGYRFSSLNTVDRKEKKVTKSAVKKRNWTRYAIVVGIMFAMYWIVSPNIKVVQLRYQLNDMKDKLVEYENENKMLQEKMNKMKTNQYVEDVARTKLGMVKQGENPVFVTETIPAESKKVETLQSQEKIGVYMKEWYSQIEKWVSDLKQRDGLKLWK